MRQTLCLLYFPLRVLIIVIFSIILSLVYWFLFFPVMIPFHIFRNLLSIIVRFRDPDVCKIVDTFSHITSRDFDEWYTKPSHCIATIFKLSGSMTIEEARQLVSDRVVYKKTCVNRKDLVEELEYPELQQYYTKRVGFLFHKWDRSFDIANHVKIYSDKELLPHPETDTVDESKLMRIWESLMTKPFMAKQSPWEVFIMPYKINQNEKEKWNVGNPLVKDHCILIFRTHHGLCDGMSIYKLLLTLTDNGMSILKKDIIAFQKPAPAFMDLFLNLSGFFCGPTSMIIKLSKGFDICNPLHVPLGKLTGRYCIVKTTFDLATIKKITCVRLNVSFHSVLIAGLTGGIRNYLLSNGHSIPLSPIRMGIPIPKLGHSMKLRNEYLLSMVDLPVHKKSPKDRLIACHKRLNNMKSEAVMPFLVQTWKLLGGLPSRLVRFFTLKSSVTVMYSEIKGPSIPLYFNERKHDTMELLFSFGLGTDDLGVGFNSISFNGKIHMMLTIDQGICKTIGKAEQLMNFIEKELEDFQCGDWTNL